MQLTLDGKALQNLHQFTKEAVEKANQAFGCQGIQASFCTLEGLEWLCPEGMTNVATKLVLLFAFS